MEAPQLSYAEFASLPEEEKERHRLRVSIEILEGSMAIYEESSKKPVGQSGWWYIKEGREMFKKKVAELRHQLESKSQLTIEL